MSSLSMTVTQLSLRVDMSSYKRQILEHFNPGWASMPLDVVTMPAPPVKAKGILYAEDCWRSDVLERAEDVFNAQDDVACISSAVTDLGPAFLLRTTLGKLLHMNKVAAVVDPIYCATISYATLLEVGDTTYATDAIIEDVRDIQSSCHPGSHTSVPGAPYMTILLQLSYALDGRMLNLGMEFADHITAAAYFPAHDFNHNQQADRLFHYLTLTDCIGNSAARFHAVLSPALRNIVQNDLVAHQNLALRLPLQPYLMAVDNLTKENYGNA